MVYALGVSRSIILAVLLTAAIARSEPVVEQTIEPLTPAQEQRVEAIGSGDDLARVDPVDADTAQDIVSQEPPNPAQKAASTVAKVLLSVASAAIAVGAMVASLLFL